MHQTALTNRTAPLVMRGVRRRICFGRGARRGWKDHSHARNSTFRPSSSCTRDRNVDTGARCKAPRGPVSVIKVTFLGTGGGAQVNIDRFGACILVEAGSQKLLFDAGRGCMFRLQQARVEFGSLTSVFITHNHSDHILSVPDLFLTGWQNSRDGPLNIWGPKGTKDMITHVVEAYQFDINAQSGMGESRRK